MIVSSATECTPLTIRHSDTNNVKGFHKDTIMVFCDEGYQTDSGGVIEVQCGAEGTWINASKCELKGNG